MSRAMSQRRQLTPKAAITNRVSTAATVHQESSLMAAASVPKFELFAT